MIKSQEDVFVHRDVPVMSVLNYVLVDFGGKDVQELVLVYEELLVIP